MEDNFYSSDSDFDDEEPKKFHIQIRPVGSSNSAATEMELKATVGALTLPPNRGVGRGEGVGTGPEGRHGMKYVVDFHMVWYQVLSISELPFS